MKRGADALDRRQTGVPVYARACGSPENYTSACSCIGIIPATIYEHCVVSLPFISSNLSHYVRIQTDDPTYCRIDGDC